MIASTLWFAALGPFALACAALVPSGTADRHPHAMRRWTYFAGLAALVASASTLVALLSFGMLRTPTTGVNGIGLALYVDALTVIMLLLVSFIGAIVLRYSRNYLDGDPHQGRFMKWLSVTLASVLILIMSGNLLQFALAWLATSLGLHRLLLFYRERPAAILAARKKFIASRIGDLCLIASMALIYRIFGSLDYAAIFSGAAALQNSPSLPVEIPAIAGLLVIAAVLKSAQFPVHGWLLEVMETPTPVSALLHAGIINAGGFLLLRFAGLLTLSAPALDMLIVIGGLTALFGSVVMPTQTSVKVSLAYSTIAQMGFMMLQCGLGAFSAALLHIVAHSLYKAHAFLSSGSVIDLSRASWTPSRGRQPAAGRIVLAIGIMVAALFAVSSLFGATLAREPGVFALGAIVVLGITHLIVNAIDAQPSFYVIGRTLLLAGAVLAAYFALQWIAAALTANALPHTQAVRSILDIAVIAFVISGFAAITIFQSLLAQNAGGPLWQAIYAHISNGFYVNTIANRLVIRFWPAPSPQPLFNMSLTRES